MSWPKVMFWRIQPGSEQRLVTIGTLLGISPRDQMFWVRSHQKDQIIPLADIVRVNFEAVHHSYFGPILKELNLETYVDGYGANVKAEILAKEKREP